MSPNYRTDYASFLRNIADELDASPEMHARLKAEYTRLGEFIREDSPTRFQADAEVYPQGSKALGTLVRPIERDADFDLDAVYCRHVRKDSVTRDELKSTMGDQLKAFVDVRRREIVDNIDIRDGQRCWTINYEGFHIDILPSVPNRERMGVEGDPIWITDRSLWHWQQSNPRGLAGWFRTRMATPRAVRMDELKKAEVTIQELPEEHIKTPLQVAVQLLKRHRDLYFAKRSEPRPISVIITTLAGQAYQGELDPYDAVLTIVRDAPNHIHWDDGRVRVSNPVDAAENFADKWNEDPRLELLFRAWLVQAKADFAGAQSEPGFDKVAKSLGSALGDDVVHRAVIRRDSALRAHREAGQLRVGRGMATLSSAGTILVPKHTFYGEPDDS